MDETQENEWVYIEIRNTIESIVLGALREQQGGRDDVVVMAEETTKKVLNLFGITEPTSMKR